jgi:WD40 repeat protein
VDVKRQLSAVILAETGRFTSRDAVDLEIEAHEKFALHRVRHFTGRQSVLDAIGEHIRSGESRPLVVHGASGCGKSAIMAKAAELAKEAVPGAVFVQRFSGVTPDASGGVSLLSSLCQQLSHEYGISEETPIGFQQLVEAFHERMARATAEQPLVIFLDALDQLRSDDEARSFTWLHQNLPPYVSLIVSTTEIPSGLKGVAEVLVEDFPADEAEEVLTAWLTDAKRELRTEHRRKVLSGFAQSGLPLYLKLAFEEARRWRSFDAADKCVLGGDVGGMIDVLFDRLSAEANHGPILVNRSLGYLAAARYGLTEDEMLDVLAADDAVWGDFNQRKHHEVSERRLPVVVWSRLSLDLEPYLTERAAPGGNVISFFHRQLAEGVASKYLEGDETQARHRDLARYFSKKPAWLDEGHKTPDARRAAELVLQQRGARLWQEAEATLFDCQFLFTKVAAGMVLDLDDDYQALLQDAPQSELPRCDTLRLIQGTLRLSLHVVTKDPRQFASQMRGRLLAHQAKPEIAGFLEDIDACTPRPRLRPLWPTLEAAGGPMLRILEGHTASVKAVALSADGKRAVSGSHDKTLRVWDLENNRPPRILEGHTGSVNAVALSADGKYAVSGSDDHTLRVWDLEGNQPPRVLEGHTSNVYAVALSADGKYAVSGSGDRTVRIWNLNGNQQMRILGKHSDDVKAVAVSADGRRAVSSSYEGRRLYVWDLEGDQPLYLIDGLFWALSLLLHELKDMNTNRLGKSWMRLVGLLSARRCRILKGDLSGVKTVAVSSDGKLVVCDSTRNSLHVWNLEENQPPRELGSHTSRVNAVALLADGKRAVSGSQDSTLQVWDLESNQPPRVLVGHTWPVDAVAVSVDGKRAVSGSWDNTVRVWDLETDESPLLLKGHTNRVNAVALSADGKCAVSGSGVHGRCSDCTVQVWDLQDNRPPRILGRHWGSVDAVAVSADGKRAVSGSLDQTVRVWDLEGNQAPRVLEGHAGSVMAVALSGDGRRIVSGSWDNAMRVWDLDGNRPPRVLEGHTGKVIAVALSSDGLRAVSASHDGSLRVWDLMGSQPPRVLEGTKASVMALSWDGYRTVYVSNQYYATKRRTLRVWDIEGDQPPRALEGHKDWTVDHYLENVWQNVWVTGVALSGDGKRAVSSWKDHTLQVWNLESGNCMTEFICDTEVWCCAWARDRIVAGDESGRVHLFAWEE